jgi:hypothetical protein
MAAVYVDNVKCRVRSLRYDFDRRVGKLNLPPDNIPDMTAAIALFESIDPRVERIVVMIAAGPDIIVFKRPGDGNKGWVAVSSVENAA